MRGILFLLALGLFVTLASAGETAYESISYTGGQSNQSMELQTETMRTEYRNEQVPYQERVCRYETRYRNECRWQPGRRVCERRNEQSCQRRNVCRTNRRGKQVCRVRRVCRSVPRNVCRQTPGRNVCRQVPRQEQVCRYETRYRNERRAYQVIDSFNYANVDFSFLTNGENQGINVDLRANMRGRYLEVSASDYSSPRRVLLTSKTSDVNQSGRNTYIRESYRVDLKSSEKVFSPLERDLTASEINDGVMRLRTGFAHHPEVVDVHLTVRSRGNTIFDRQLSQAEYRWRNRENSSRVVVNLRSLLGSSYSGQELELTYGLSIQRNRVLNSDQFSNWNQTKSFYRVWR